MVLDHIRLKATAPVGLAVGMKVCVINRSDGLKPVETHHQDTQDTTEPGHAKWPGFVSVWGRRSCLE